MSYAPFGMVDTTKPLSITSGRLVRVIPGALER